jgi:hypothetical protein
LTNYKGYANNINMNGGLSITERLSSTGPNAAPMPPVEQVPPAVPEAAPTQWRMEGDLFSDEAGRAEAMPIAPETVAGIGHIAARSSEVSVDSAILPPESPTQLPKRVDPYLRPSGPNITHVTEEQRAAKQRQLDAFFGYADHPNAVGAPRPASVLVPTTRVPGQRPSANPRHLQADNDHFARMNGAA